ncbi:hypothetical protein BDR22DRAFT_808903, partial [Usnea florida]
KAVYNIIDKTITKFLYNNIFINYRPPRELLLDNRTNFLNRVVALYLIYLKTRYYIIILYYPRINRKVKNLNSLLGKILIKYLINKLT